VDLWMRDITPSDGLRRWFAHDRSKWEEFRELEGKRRLVEELFELEKKYGSVTLLYCPRPKSQQRSTPSGVSETSERGSTAQPCGQVTRVLSDELRDPFHGVSHFPLRRFEELKRRY
jgi:hypothetical protein